MSTPNGDDLRRKWDARHAGAQTLPPPAEVLTGFAHLLPERGQALDLACGLGANALFLAQRGLQVCAWDLSPVAIRRLQDEAGRRGLVLEAVERDVQLRPPQADSFDVILVCHFLDRNLAPVIARALRPGGLLYYQTFVREAVSDCGPSNPAFRLEANELLRLFNGLRLLVYRDEGRVGDLSRGFRDRACLVAQRGGVGT